MARKTIVVPESAEEWLHRTDDKILECRGQRHDFPKIRRGTRAVPKGLRVARVDDGCFQVTFTCPSCGTERVLTTLPGGEFDYPAKYTYRHPPGYKAPKGSEITRRDCFMETWRRTVEDGALAITAGPAVTAVPEVEFRGAAV